ncbi:heme ABC transporter ATP-binding protein [Stagnihabitans tardus]|uniref:Heme ABC transporter ATP-binding protein n=1 Tax=Stagnihabitans tardus TaxID=2699202 RepID=A0AAE4Y621_9RHOB|nr:heme ABC transporter ATP-binding protein [Stagnihabitans tardus]NBZ86461.1 heme ABC transporter ATP-binding protein [Stagnihabitans tardus]
MTLEARNLTLHRAGRPVLNDLTLRLHPGEVTVLIGPNGSGKSSLLAALSGTLPFDGQVLLNGQDIRQIPAPQLALRRAVMAQETTLAFPFPVEDIVALGASRPLPPARIAALLSEVGLKGFAHRNAMELSGGEAQRMHLARALAQAETGLEPFWLMLDEPVSSLDLAHQVAVIDRARAFAAAGGGALVVLHDLNLAFRGADRILVLHQGALVADGAPSEVMSDALIARVYGCEAPLNRLPPEGPFLLVQAVQPSARQNPALRA